MQQRWYCSSLPAREFFMNNLYHLMFLYKMSWYLILIFSSLFSSLCFPLHIYVNLYLVLSYCYYCYRWRSHLHSGKTLILQPPHGNHVLSVGVMEFRVSYNLFLLRLQSLISGKLRFVLAEIAVIGPQPSWRHSLILIHQLNSWSYVSSVFWSRSS